MKTISTKAEIKLLCGRTLQEADPGNAIAITSSIRKHFLEKKIKFPLLEFAARDLFSAIPEEKQLEVCDGIIELDTIGGNVMIGMMLQLRLEKNLRECFEKACAYIDRGDEWYVCDIIGERVMGHSLLCFPEKTIPILKKLARHESSWVVRTVGVATHYATKKGLEKKFVEEMFLLLLSLSSSSDFHVKTGTGWGAKTCTKFYPDLVKKHIEKLESPEVKQWFRTKVNIGLGRASKYASRYNS